MKLYESKNYTEYTQRCKWFRDRNSGDYYDDGKRDVLSPCCAEAAYDAGLDDTWGKVYVYVEAVNGAYCFTIHIHFHKQSSWESSSFFMDELDRAKRNIQFVVSGRLVHKKAQIDERTMFWNAIAGNLSRIFEA